MSLSPETMMELMAYADGELEGADRARIEDLLRGSEEARGVVAALGTLGEVVREGSAELPPASARVADGIADGVMAAITRDAATTKAHAGSSNVTSIGAARASRMRLVSGVAAVLAIAAGLALVLRAKPGPSITVDDHTFARGGSVATSSSAPAALTAPAPPSAVASADTSDSKSVDLEEAESTRGKVDVFFTQSHMGSGAASVVVWIDDRHGGK